MRSDGRTDAGPGQPITADLLEAVDLLVPNEHEAELLTGAHDPRTAAETLLAEAHLPSR